MKRIFPSQYVGYRVMTRAESVGALEAFRVIATAGWNTP
jgi:hypothetical protein